MLNICPKRGTVRNSMSSNRYLAEKSDISNLEATVEKWKLFCIMMRKS